jgi:alkanesulfonate monooxygenase SsuD/methylene tetrahydromethanopterin reductase-like flavin-dependent oxidoreductase (luciferase family)
LPYHHPVTLAKRPATIDVLSRGRMRLLRLEVTRWGSMDMSQEDVDGFAQREPNGS